MSEHVVYDAVVLGAGPAGLAAAVALADEGARVALVDAGAQLGGQYYRQTASAFAARRPGRLHHHWRDFTRLADRCARHQSTGLIRYVPRTEVWAVERLETASEGAGGFRVYPTTAENRPLDARTLLLATGAYERQIPFPGWDLPGVVTAGGAQALLKESLAVPKGRVVVAGTGPLLLPVAAGLAAAGADVVGLYEAGRFRTYAGSARSVWTLATHPEKVAEAIGYGAALARFRVPVRSGRCVVAAYGADRLEAVRVARVSGSGVVVPGSEETVACETLAVGYGLIPQVELGLELGCAHRIAADKTVVFEVDGEQRTGVAGVWAAGEVTGVAGAGAAVVAGEIAGRSMARWAGGDGMGRMDEGGVAWLPGRLVRKRDRAREFAELLMADHPVPEGWEDRLAPETLVCRCEQVPARAVAEALGEFGARDVRTAKLLTRAGMGWCQGRMCGPALVALAARRRAAEERGGDSGGGDSDGGDSDGADAELAQDLLAAARRPIARPVPLGVVAGRYEESDNDREDQGD